MLKLYFALPLLLIFSLFTGMEINPVSTSRLDAGMAICHSEPLNDMRQWAMDPEFQALHPAPVSIIFEGIGAEITMPAADGMEAKGYLVKAKKKSNKWLFVYQEWWGLNDYIRREADKFYKDLGENVNVLALDMYDGKSTSDPQEAGKLISSTKEERLINIVKAGYDFAGAKAQVASVGWCFGGSWSLRSAIIGGKNNIGSVIYYGMPVDKIDELKKLNSDVLGLFATETRISKEVIEKFAENMKAAGKGLEYKIFPGVHGFANPSNPKYDKENAEVAYGMALKYLKGKF
ncbi:MAG: dienelactone hydrolase family protein [Cytophagaceae bacterium]|nr:dienelactone hydrolase family protein [Cytophagaceae bacterium]MBL0301229.1 dienelactone hydrolase family protein [Cytophagaceae bacterium]MBL0324046.1 dienelactone hydrolase family protein [Cytophagaceae bacterium]